MFHPKDDPCCLPCCPACPCRCPAPVITVGSTTTTPPGTEAKVTATPTADGVRLDFFIPQGEPGTAPEDVFASFYTFMQRFANGSAIPFAQAVEDPTGQITLQNATQIRLEPGYYLITYHVSAILETAGYLQVTPAYGGQGHLEYGVYNRTGIDNTSVSGSASFIISVEEATRFSLNSNSSVTVRDGEATLVILALQPSREA